MTPGGFKPDQRDYGIGVQICETGRPLHAPLSNIPASSSAIEGYGLSVTKWLPIEIPASPSTLRYLTTNVTNSGTS